MPEAYREHVDKAVAAYKAGRLDEAIAEFREAARLEPQHASAHYNLGSLLEARGRLAEAAAAFEACLACAGAKRPEHAEAARGRLERLKKILAQQAAAPAAAQSAAMPKAETMTLGGASLEAPARPGETQTLGPAAARPGETRTLGPSAVPGASISPGAARAENSPRAAGSGETMTLGPGVASPGAPRPPGLSWHPGDVFEDLYEVRSVLGEGGFGTVHKVHHRGWGMDLAVKAPRADRVADRRALESFVQEANTWVGLGLHPHIVTCFYVRLMGVPRIFIEYMEGGSLSDWLKAGKVRNLTAALDVAIQIARAVEYSHSRGLVHRDLKPGNCLLTHGGSLKVTDFGLAKIGDQEDGPEPEAADRGARIAKVKEATRTGRLGTPEYMAPEQWTRPREAGPAADAWAFGVILYELCRGRNPFQMADGEPVDSYYARLLESGWSHEKLGSAAAFGEVLSRWRTPDDPTGLSKVETVKIIGDAAARCLAPDPAKRPADFKELAALLESVYEKAAGKPYPRAAAKESPLLADALMNQGVSMADLGRTEEALRLFEEALKLDPTHPGAVYDQGIVLSRAGKLSEAELVARLFVCKKARAREWEPCYLLGLAHLGRKDAPAALQELSEAAALSKGNALVSRAQRKARAGEFDGPAELFVALPKGIEGARIEAAAFEALMARALQEAAAGAWDKAYATALKARGVKGYEHAASAVELAHKMGAKGARKGLTNRSLV